jgi:hypothetical protein
MSDFEECIVIELRKTLLLSLDDLLVITRQFTTRTFPDQP